MATTSETPTRRLLLTSQRDDVFRAIEQFGLDPRAFVWSETASPTTENQVVSRLGFGSTGFYFTFDLREGRQHFAEFSPGSGAPVEDQLTGSWQGQMGYVSNWLHFLTREVNAPNLWSAAEAGDLLTAIASQSMGQSGVFTQPEIELIRARIDQVRAFLSQSAHAPPEQLAEANQKLDLLLAAAMQSSKAQWVHTAIGVLATITVSLSLAPEQSRTMFRLLGQAVQHLLAP